MKAIVTTRYGTPDVLQLQEVEKPIPKDNEVLIKVHAGVVTSADCSFRKGDPFIIKLMYGLRKPRLKIPGVEFSGEIEVVGKDVKQFRKGDQVFGMSPDHFGAHGEYLCLAETKPLTIKSPSASHEEMAGVSDGATTALTFLRNFAKVQSGQKVLINGASGAVGTYAVQIAKYYGAEVTGVCSATNIEMVKALGADHIIDYTKTDFAKTGKTYDVIFDAVGKSSFGHCKGALTPKGIYLTTVPTFAIVRQMLWNSMRGGKKAKFVAAGLMQNRANLDFLRELFEGGHLKAVIDRCYPLEQLAEAHRYVDKGHKKGNVVINVAT